MNWEYKVELLPVSRDTEALETLLNDLGAEGWELVTVFEAGRAAFFKRKVTGPTALPMDLD